MIDGDMSFACPSRRSARWLAAGIRALPVYLYHFVHSPAISAADKHILCCHSCELGFVFHDDALLITKGERDLSSKMVSLWSSFAINHFPADNATWPAYEQLSDQNIVLDATLFEARLSVQSNLKQVGCYL
jgi:hypothetical protein